MSPANTHVVTAVIVAHDGAAWLPHVTQALRSQTRPVQRAVAVDTGSRDRSGAMLAELLGRGSVFGMDRGTGYGAAVHRALRHRAANTHIPSPGGQEAGRTEWVWLLHDDCEPEPDALELLLHGAAQTPGAAVFGPKLMDWSDRDVLLEAGVTIDRAGRRVTGIEPREIDQGQHDGDRDVLAVGSAGMLIRRDVWDQVGGFDPGMLLYREDVDFCWRVHAAGYRVRVITDAVVHHVEASARNRRRASAAPRRLRQDRRNALSVLLGNLPARPMLAALGGNLSLSVLRILFFLIAKRPGAALDELSAITSVTGHPVRLITARRHRGRGRRAAFSRLRGDLPPGRTLRRLAEFASGTLAKSGPAGTVGSHHATEDPSDDESLLVDTGLAQRLLTNPGVLLFLGLLVVTLVAARHLLAGTPLGGGALVPAWGGASALWQEYVQGFHPAGLGTAATTPAYVAVIAALATILGGKPWLAVDVILIGCVPVSGITAYLATRRVVRFAPVRVWAGASYALLPVGMGAVAAGRLGTAVVLALLPLAAVLAARIFTEPRRRARRAAWAAGLVLALAAAFVPLIWLIAIAAVALGAVVFGRRNWRAAALNTAVVAVVPAVLLLPWTVTLLTHPAQLFLEAGLQRPGLASPGLSARSLLLLSPGGPGLPPVWVTAGLGAAALIVLAASGRRPLVLAGWGVAAIGLLTAAAVRWVDATPAAGGARVAAWPGIALAVAAGGLLLAVAAAANGLQGRLRSGGWHAPRGLAALAVAAVAFSAPLLSAAFWVTSGVRGPVAPVTGPVLPEFVTVSAVTGHRLRTLVLRAGGNGGVTYSVLRSTDPLLGTPGLGVPPAAARALTQTVGALVAPHGSDVQDPGRALASFGIGYVLMPRPVDAGLARLVDAVPGLQPVSKTPAFELWQVTGPVARVSVREPGGKVVPVPSGTVDVTGAKAPAAGGTLVLAEPAGGWQATLNGRPLSPLTAPVGGWAQGFRLPPGGGTLSISRSEIGRDLAVGLEGIAFLVVAVLGLPGARVAGEPEAEDVRAGGRARDLRGRRSLRRGGAEPPADVAAPAPRPATRERPPVPVPGRRGGPGEPPARPDLPAHAGPRDGRRGPGRRAAGPPARAGNGGEGDAGRGRAPLPERAAAGRHAPHDVPGEPQRRDPLTDPGAQGPGRRSPRDWGRRSGHALPDDSGGGGAYERPGSGRRPEPGPGGDYPGRGGLEPAAARGERRHGGPPAGAGSGRPGQDRRPERDRRPGRGLPRGRLAGDDETLPPAPPRSSRGRGDPGEYAADDGRSAATGRPWRRARGSERSRGSER